jgi:hypothetical protein
MADGPWGVSPALEALARPLLRALLRDAGAQQEEPAALERLRARLGGALLRADWPAALSVAAPPLAESVPAALAGTLSIRDAALLPGGKALVALGEAGVLLLSREGRRLHHFEQPAEKLVLSSRGDRALALAPRGRLWRVARLDLVGQRSRVWREVELTAWAPEFNGASWLVGVQGGLLCEIDALDPGWSALWQIREPRQRVAACWYWTQSGALVPAAVFEDTTGSAALWQFDPASRGLLRRDLLPAMAEPRCDSFAWVGSDTGALRCESFGRIHALSGAGSRLLCLAPGGRYGVVARGSLVGVTSEDKAQLWGLDPAGAVSLKGSLTLGGAAETLVHLSPFGVAVADERGRLVSLAVDHAGRLRMLRTLRVG